MKYNNNITREEVTVGTIMYHNFEDSIITKVVATSDGGDLGCCIEPVHGNTEAFAIDVAVYDDLYTYPFEVTYSELRQEVYVSDLLGNQLFTIPSDEVVDKRLLELDLEELYIYVATYYMEVIEDCTEIQ